MGIRCQPWQQQSGRQKQYDTGNDPAFYNKYHSISGVLYSGLVSCVLRFFLFGQSTAEYHAASQTEHCSNQKEEKYACK